MILFFKLGFKEQFRNGKTKIVFVGSLDCLFKKPMFSDILGLAILRMNFANDFFPPYSNPLICQGKFNPYVSDSFAFKSSKCCFVKVLFNVQETL